LGMPRGAAASNRARFDPNMALNFVIGLSVISGVSSLAPIWAEIGSATRGHSRGQQQAPLAGVGCDAALLDRGSSSSSSRRRPVFHGGQELGHERAPLRLGHGAHVHVRRSHGPSGYYRGRSGGLVVRNSCRSKGGCVRQTSRGGRDGGGARNARWGEEGDPLGWERGEEREALRLILDARPRAGLPRGRDEDGVDGRLDARRRSWCPPWPRPRRR